MILALLKTKEGMIGALVVLIVIVGAAWVNGAIQSAEARGEARLMAAQAQANWEALLDSVDTWQARDAVKDSAHAAEMAEFEAQSGAARAELETALQANMGLQGTIARLRETPESCTLADVQEIEATVEAFQTAAETCDAALGNCETMLRESDLRLFDTRAQRDESLAVARQQALVIDRLQDLQRPRMNTLGYAGWIVAIAEAALLALSLAGG
jgi:hypothetical protein